MTHRFQPDSLILKIDINDGVGESPFPSYSLREDLFQNSIRVVGLYCEKGPMKETNFVISNSSEHGVSRKVIKNILGIFTFSAPKTFLSNPNKEIKPAINVVPENLKFKVVKDNFKLSQTFNGWLIAEISGLKKGSRVE